MSYLKDLSVSKVSFVHKAANKRRFLLLKSETETETETETGPEIEIEIKKGEVYKPMRKEVKDKLIEVIKSGKVHDQIVDVLKSETVLAVTESEVAEISDYIDVVKQTAVEKKKKDMEMDASGTPQLDKANDNDNDEDNKTKMKKEEDVEKQVLLQKIDSLTTTLEKLTKDSKRRDIVSWLQKECPFLMDDIQKTADDILELEAVSPSATEKYKTGLQKASATVEGSKLFTENGVSTDTLLKSESDGFELISKFNNGLQTLKKSTNNGAISASDIVNLVKGFGDNYAEYRVAHIRRAKRDAI